MSATLVDVDKVYADEFVADEEGGGREVEGRGGREGSMAVLEDCGVTMFCNLDGMMGRGHSVLCLAD